MGEIDDYKYLGICMDAKLKGHVHLEKILQKWPTESGINGKSEETERGVFIWEAMGLPAVNYAAEVRWKGNKAQQKKLNAVQEQVGRK